MTVATPPRRVSRFEHDLLVILRYLLGHESPQRALILLISRQSAPPCLSRACVDLVQDTLAKGIVLHLVRAGGWRSEPFLEGGQPVGGRVWERIPQAGRGLEFSPAVLEFLIWLTAEKIDSANDQWLSTNPLTAADELFLALAFERLRSEVDILAALRLRDAFAKNPLCWLLSPAEFARGANGETPDFLPLFTGCRAAILECLQPALAKHWIAKERQKGLSADWEALRLQGIGETAMLSGVLAAAEQARRPDLVRFVLRVLAAVFEGQTPDATYWTGGLNANAPPRLADRLAIQRNALAFPRQAEVLARWDRQARAIGYFDDDYAASQLWKEDYEAARGPEILAKSQRALAQLEPLKV